VAASHGSDPALALARSTRHLYPLRDRRPPRQPQSPGRRWGQSLARPLALHRLKLSAEPWGLRQIEDRSELEQGPSGPGGVADSSTAR